jgi:methyl-accepting chemotaxis protein
MDRVFANRRSIWNSLRVEEDFTTRQIVRVIGFAGIYTGLATGLVCVFYLYVLNPAPVGVSSVAALVGDIGVRWQGAPELRGALGIWLLGMVGMSGLFAMATGIVFSRRLAGPLHHLKRDLTRIAEGGEVRPIQLREGDEMQDLADVIHAALLSVQQRRGDSELTAVRAEQNAERLAECVDLLRLHLGRLDAFHFRGSDELAVGTWAEGMRTLLDKAERSEAV